MENKKRVIALGFFDGVHLGHQALLKKTVTVARQNGYVPAVISFDTHPDQMVTGETVPLLNTPFDRADMLKRLFSMEEVIFLHFDRTLMNMDWMEFVKWLVKSFGAAHLIAGYDFRFGYNGMGNAEKLAAECARLQIGCDIIPQVKRGGMRISSTYIRELIAAGEIERANEFLGHPHLFSGVVRNGYRFGRKMGIPTINMRFDEGVLIPARGVYSTKVCLSDGRSFMAVTNIGVRPTMGDGGAISVESHLLDFSGDLYGQKVRVEFYQYLRPEGKFESTDILKKQILQNIEQTRRYFAQTERTAAKIGGEK